MKIGQILREKQPEIYKKLNIKNKRRDGTKKEHLSFYDIDKLMREANGVDFTRCKGR